MYERNFELALKFLFPAEGGYSNHKNDKGGATNMGVTQYTYDYYRQRVGLPLQNVIKITKEEVKQIYYYEYWIKSGANQEKDLKMAIVLFDTAVLHGPAKARKMYQESEKNIKNFLDIRKKTYDEIVKSDPSQRIFYNGWINRVNSLSKYVENLSGMESIQFTHKNSDISTGYAADIKRYSASECAGTYDVSGYTRKDGTKVKSYQRTCGAKHDKRPKIPPLQNLSKDEIDKLVREYI